MNPKKIESEIFKSFSFMSHGFLTRDFGSHQAEEVILRDSGGSRKTICRLKQVHSDHVVEICEEDSEKYRKEEADAMVTRLKGIALTIVTADCIPLLFCDPNKKIIAAAHAGWRGTSAKIAQQTVRKMIEHGADTKDIYVALGPAIQKCCYEVDEKVYRAICHSGENRHPRESGDPPYFEPVSGKKGHWRLNLPEVNRKQLMEMGVPKDHIWLSPDCTACLEDQFFSYRREGEKAGRQWSYIALK